MRIWDAREDYLQRLGLQFKKKKKIYTSCYCRVLVFVKQGHTVDQTELVLPEIHLHQHPKCCGKIGLPHPFKVRVTAKCQGTCKFGWLVLLLLLAL